MITLRFPTLEGFPERNLIVVTGYEKPYVFKDAKTIADAKTQYLNNERDIGGVVPPFAFDENNTLYDAWTEQPLRHIKDSSYFKAAQSNLETSAYFD